jgi:hypothetical protein
MCPPWTVAPSEGYHDCLPCGQGFTTLDGINCHSCPINFTTNVLDGGLGGCIVSCENFTGSGKDYVTAGYGGPCFDPLILELDPSALTNRTLRPSLWFYPSNYLNQDDMTLSIILFVLSVLIIAVFLVCLARICFRAGQSRYSSLPKTSLSIGSPKTPPQKDETLIDLIPSGGDILETINQGKAHSQ